MKIIRFMAVAIVLVMQAWACSPDKTTGQGFDNQPPSVWLASAPPEGSISTYTIHLWWGGWDPDGDIAYYEYVITNNEGGVFDPADTTGADKWNPVFGNDSIFTLSADIVADSTDLFDDDGNLGGHEPEEFRRSHTFFIRAVDDRGMRTKKPVYRSFTARTLSPTVDVLIPRATGLNPAQVPPITTFSWSGRDYVSNTQQVQDPDSSRFILVSVDKFDGNWEKATEYIQKTPDAPEWSEWIYYRQPADTGKFWTSPPLDLGPYMFAVQVMDEAGAVSPVFDLDHNARRLQVSQRQTGPVFTVFNEFVGSIITSSSRTPPTIVDLPLGVPMRFTLSATAESYGGVVAGYRYGWDILDLNDDEQWDVDWTPFTGNQAVTPQRTFFFGTHNFFAEVIDNSGLISRVQVTVNIIQFTMQNSLLFVDDWREGGTGWIPTRGAIPSDAQHDAFWRDMLADVEGFDPDNDVRDLGGGELPIGEVAKYQNIIWSSAGSHGSTSEAFMRRVIRFRDPTRPSTGGGKAVPNLIALFMAAGGHVLVCGQEVMTMAISRESFGNQTLAFPMIFRYESSGDQDGSYGDSDIGVRGIGDNSFAYKECCMNVLDIAYIASPNSVRRPPNQQFPPGTGCPVHFLRDHGQQIGTGRQDGLRRTLPLDETTGGGFPMMTLRREAAGVDTLVGDSLLFYHVSNVGLNTDIYNPSYFADMTPCAGIAEYGRDCFEPIWGLGCENENSVVYNAPVAFWTRVFENRVPDVGGVAARSAVWGFHPVFFNPDQVKEALDIVLFTEWGLTKREEINP